MTGVVDSSYGPESIGPDSSFPVISPNDNNRSCGEATVNMAISRPPMRLITSFNQKMDKISPLQQIAEQTGPEEQVVMQGYASEEDDGEEPGGGSTKGVSETRADGDAETVFSVLSMSVPTCEQTHKKLCGTLKNLQGVMDKLMKESKSLALSQRRKENEVLLHSCSNRVTLVSFLGAFCCSIAMSQ
ncbi:hypothetical protein NDU88_004384 [Pleurodeles waltl]|uniref:Uncharacterized protein n=1 Tax=Pleurodeles waltl TaxID=8319 RepID=A0AAV7UEZ5_PLEWA|nr:hypothetical protein NDU88_004384 [Pleurodeles waltl]